MIGDWFRLCLLSSGSLFGVYIVFGLLMDRIEALNTYFIWGTVGKVGIMITGWIGTVVHEFSHYIMCLVFRHRVVEVAWFRPLKGIQDGVLGYVQHSYDPSNWYQQIGNFFIGIAPLLVGSLIILILFKLFLPKSAKGFTQAANSHINEMSSHFSVGAIFKLLWQQTGNLFKQLFTKENMKRPIFWIFLFMVYSISTHMSLSMADLKGAAVGLGVMLVAIMVFSALMAVLRLPLKKLAPALIKYNSWVISIFSIGLSFSLLTLLISGALYFIF